MNKWLLGIVAALVLALGLPAITSAHVLKIDGTIGAVLHINPDDGPTTGTPTDYVLSFSDDTGRFSLSKCNCSVTVLENGRAIATKPLAASSNRVSENRYTFIKPAVYTLRFSGAPKTPGEFQAFTLAYEVRVTDGQTKVQAVPLALWVGMGMGIGLILLAAYAMDYNAATPKKILA
jgi:hypothetical protein